MALLEITAGMIPTAAELTEISRRVRFARQTADQNSTTTTLADTELTVTLDENSTYLFMILAGYIAPTAADYKYGYTVPSGATGRVTTYYNSSSDTTPFGLTATAAQPDFTTTVVGNGTATTHCSIRHEGIIICTFGGSFTYRFAQNAASGTSTFQDNSFIYCVKVD